MEPPETSCVKSAKNIFFTWILWYTEFLELLYYLDCALAQVFTITV